MISDHHNHISLSLCLDLIKKEEIKLWTQLAEELKQTVWNNDAWRCDCQVTISSNLERNGKSCSNADGTRRVEKWTHKQKTCNLNCDWKHTLQWSSGQCAVKSWQWYIDAPLQTTTAAQKVKQLGLPLLARTDDSCGRCLRLHIECRYNDYKKKSVVTITEVAKNNSTDDYHH